ncbi:hypothetical protein BGZ67_001864 [Mortierella alpina]|nr:hypothetical protein BGZ67_001864 [Mortierella alpina]
MHSINSDTPLPGDACPIHDIYDTFDELCDVSSSISDAYDSSREELGYEDTFYDYYDIQLEPRQLHKSKASKLKRRAETKILLPILRTSRRHYSFPVEVLDLVCSHLSQATLRCVVSLVCKEWYTVSQRYIRRTGAWENATMDQENRLLERMPRLYTLECYVGNQLGCFSAYDRQLLEQFLCASWNRFTTAIIAPFSASASDQHTDSTKPQCLLHYIRRLVLKGPQMTYEVSILQVLGHLRFLQSLELHVKSTLVPLFKLLDNSPSLRELRVASQYYQLAQVISGDDEDLIIKTPNPGTHPATAQSSRRPPVIDPPKAYSSRYKLRVFDVKYVIVSQRILERVMATCPGLRVFKAHEINENMPLPGHLSMKKYCRIDEERLWHHLRNCCPKIDCYHISFQVSRSDTDKMEPLRRMYQSITLGRFLTTIGNVDWLNYLQDLSIRRALQHVTVLEVLPKSSYQKGTQSLQQLLCLMPNLLHVIATDVFFTPNEVLVIPGCARPDTLRKRFNYHNQDRKRQERKEKRQQRQKALERFQVPAQDRLDAIPEVWQCRDLRTLSIDFGGWGNSFSLFTQYVAGHRLLRNLTSLSLGINELKVGQVKEKPPTDVAAPERWENDFLVLRGLRCLETLDIKTRSIMGVIQITDFEFLRKQDSSGSSQVMVIIAAKNKDAGSDMEEDSARKRYGRHVIAGIERIRPGVEFSIKHNRFSPGSTF